ncbi:MAG: vWA domain-containing protein [Polyangiaceae bacterium]
MRGASGFGRALAWGITAIVAIACGSKERPPLLGDPVPPNEGGSTGSGGSGGGGCIEDAALPPSPDAQGLCGNTFLNATADPPNVYFVLDRSGSMQEIVDGRMKWDAVASASVALVRRLGSQVNVGAAVFPDPSMNPDLECAAGAEVFTTRPGDPLENRSCNIDGDVTRAFSRSISLPSRAVPLGGTPTSSTLARLVPTLSALPGRTVVILATDGGPNCNAAAMCDESKCIPNIEGAQGCGPGVNCCSPALGGPGSCLDDLATIGAVATLARLGIKTYVVGIPGTAPYATLLTELARTGGTMRTTGNGAGYYDVDHLTELDDILASIGSTVLLSCHLHLDTPPRENGLVNVYLDRQLVEYGGPNGWVWTYPGDAGAKIDVAIDDAQVSDVDPTDVDSTDVDTDASDDAPPPDDAGTSDDVSTPDDAPGTADARLPRQDIDLLGDSCALLMSGKVRRVQVVFGCPTVIPK